MPRSSPWSCLPNSIIHSDKKPKEVVRTIRADACSRSVDIIETAEPAPAQSAGALSPSPTPASTYASCDEAEAAGEPRVHGSNGSGRGFPRARCRAPATAMVWCVNGDRRFGCFAHPLRRW